MICRPRLADHFAARLHRVAGQELVALHDRRTGSLAVIGAREWAVLRAADGTRDADGIAAAAKQRGVAVSREAAQAWLAELDAAGMMADGAPVARVAPPARTSDAPRAIAPLPGFRLRCDGRGSCCRLYPTTVFSAHEMTRARALLPEVLDCGRDASLAFSPCSGAGEITIEAAGPAFAGAAVAMVDGRCAFLGSSGCRLHARGGAAAKPLGCGLFPAVLTDDGRSIAVTAAPECACVFRSARSPEDAGEPLTTARREDELDPAVFVQRLPARIAIAPCREVDRQAYLDWHEERAQTGWHAAGDVPAALCALGAELEAEGPGRAELDVPGASELRAVLATELERLSEQAAERAKKSGWRARADLARLVPTWLARAAERAREMIGAPAGAGDAADERFYLVAVAHGHLWLRDDRPLSEALRGRAARLLAARCMREVAGACGDDDPALDHPLALVEAMARLLS